MHAAWNCATTSCKKSRSAVTGAAIQRRSTRQILRKLNEVRRSLLSGYQEPCPPLHEAAQRALMSPTKFKTLFKQMFGHTYYQFYKQIRMHKARELLLARQNECL